MAAMAGVLIAAIKLVIVLVSQEVSEQVHSAAEVTTWQTKVAVSCSIFGETAGEGLPTL